jgi:hypothetical protein
VFDLNSESSNAAHYSRKRAKPGERLPDKPLRAIIGTTIVLALIFGYFYYFQPYNSTNGSLFWLAFIVWASPLALVGWVYRNAPKQRANTAFGRLMVALGAAGIIVYVISTRTSALDPLVLSGWPAWPAGAIVGSDLALISRLRRRPKQPHLPPPSSNTA